jgi:exodeoxyribonuclease VII large subunit
VIDKNPWGYKFFFMLFVAQVNGDPAVASIMQQLKRIEKVKHHFDAVAIIRGGGGEIGLSCYNHFELAKAIATFPLPVLTGIGHSTNVTVSELVSFRNAITPTELADFLIQCYHGVAQPLAEWKERIRSKVQVILQYDKTRLKEEIRVFRNTSVQVLRAEKAVLSEQMKNTVQLSSYRFRAEHSGFEQLKLNTQRAYIARKKLELKLLHDRKFELEKLSKQRIFEANQGMDDHRYFLLKEVPKQTKSADHLLLQLEQNIRLVDPINVLKRGYAVVTFQGKVVAKEMTLNTGEVLEIRTFDFEMQANITHINKTIHE